MASIPVVMTATGMAPQDPTTLQQAIIAEAETLSPGLTATLPASLVEDMSSTATGAAILCDQAAVASVNNVTPLGANVFVLNNLGQIYGVQQGIGTNASVYVTFTGSVGFVIPIGFTVSDGSHQYTVQDGGIVLTGGSSVPLFCLATTAGTWTIPANTVTTLVTSLPTGVTLTCTNTAVGTPQTSAQTTEDYRSQVLQAGQAPAQGMTTMLRRTIQAIPGVQSRLVSIRVTSAGYEIIVGGSGDPYAIANAIFLGLFDFWNLVQSTQGAATITNITQANPGVVTTSTAHGYTNGDEITITGVVGMTQVNGHTYFVTVTDSTHFSIGVDSSGYTAYTSGGTSENTVINQVVSINDSPDTYNIPFVVPPLQTVSVGLTWNTTATNYISDAAVAALGSPAIVSYINSITVGAPINIFELQSVFQVAVANVIPTPQLSKMVFSIEINGVSISPADGTGLVQGDSESYFFTSSTNVAILRG